MPANKVSLRKLSDQQHPLLTLEVCSTFVSKFKGLMFQKTLDPSAGLLFDEQRDTRVNTAIHMFFMRFPIAVFWVNNDMCLVAKVLAKPWRPFYAPSVPARYIIETHASNLELLDVGDKILFDEV